MSVVELREHSNMTVEQALACASREDWNEVMIIGYIDGKFHTRSSSMSVKDALWLVELERRHIFEQRDED